MAKLLVTGTDSALGSAIAVGLAQDGHVVAAGSATGGWPAGSTEDLQLEPVRLDPRADDASIDEAVDGATRILGGLDGVVLESAAGPLMPIELIDGDVLAAAIDLNLTGPIRVLQRTIPHLRASTDGRIVAISSVAATTGLPMSGVCSAAKAGLEAALESLRHELRPDAIKVSVVQTARPEPSVGRDFIDRRGDSHYGPLAETARALREQASRWGDGRLVVEQIRRVLAEDDPDFRYSLGGFATLASELRAGDAELRRTIEELYRLDEWLVRTGS